MKTITFNTVSGVPSFKISQFKNNHIQIDLKCKDKETSNTVYEALTNAFKTGKVNLTFEVEKL